MKSAHLHLISALAAELYRRGTKQAPVRILDIGCGFGQLIRDVRAALPSLCETLKDVEVYGFEVYDHRAGIPGYRESMLQRLAVDSPGIDWSHRVRMGAARDSWPFPDGFFDAAYSNQVLEHVEDLEFFFDEQSRVLRQDGVAIHFYPSLETMVEPHCGVPFAHRVERAHLCRWIRGWSRLGVGKFLSYWRQRGATVRSFGDEFHEYLGRYVFFRRNSEIRALARKAGGTAGFAYSGDLILRALADDWDIFRYADPARLNETARLAPLMCTTLVQRF